MSKYKYNYNLTEKQTVKLQLVKELFNKLKQVYSKEDADNLRNNYAQVDKEINLLFPEDSRYKSIALSKLEEASMIELSNMFVVEQMKFTITTKKELLRLSMMYLNKLITHQ